LFAQLALFRTWQATQIVRDRTACIRRHERADFQARKAIQGSVKHHAGKKDSRFERISDDVAQVTFSLQAVGLDDILAD